MKNRVSKRAKFFVHQWAEPSYFLLSVFAARRLVQQARYFRQTDQCRGKLRPPPEAELLLFLLAFGPVHPRCRRSPPCALPGLPVQGAAQGQQDALRRLGFVHMGLFGE